MGKSTVAKVLDGDEVDMFPPGNKHHLELVFSRQLKWKAWRLQLALDLTELGFTQFAINGFGETTARAKVNVHDLDVVVSYIPARGQVAIYKEGDNTPLLIDDNITYDVGGDGWLYDTAHRLVGDLLLWREEQEVASGCSS